MSVISAPELYQELQGENKPTLLDVREAHELAISSLDIDHHIPLGQLERRYTELNPEANIVVICRSGARSGSATHFLLKHGFSRVRNLVGGMNGWADTVDPTVTKY
ncbi:MAG TPA: rhodanese-like domain-containing protein [Fimbriimonadaceae bacterium]|nr:rhodanese-like domain-containing protein [Fimbriimonadaceae bacterium]